MEARREKEREKDKDKEYRNRENSTPNANNEAVYMTEQGRPDQV